MNEQQNLIIAHFAESLGDLTLLARGIERPCVVAMIKSSKSLRQSFSGFRPDHPPWGRVPNTLANYSVRNLDRTNWLISNWFLSSSNKLLHQNVTDMVRIEKVRSGIVEVLAQSNGESRETLLCALLLDERPEVREAATNEFRQQLLDKNSELVRQAQARFVEVEKERAAERALKAVQDKAEDTKRQLEERSHEFQELKVRFNELERQVEEAHASLETVQRARDEAEQERDEQRRAAEHAQMRECEAETRRQDLELQNAELQTQLGVLRATQARVVELETARSELEEAKNRAEGRSRYLEREHRRLQRALEDEHKHPRHTVSLAMLDESWSEVLGAVAGHLRVHAVVATQPVETSHSNGGAPDENAPVTAIDPAGRADDWRKWQQLETRFAQSLLESPSSDFDAAPPDELEEHLSEARRAQQLLALRWYLIEGFRLRLLESLRSANLINGESNPQGDAL